MAKVNITKEGTMTITPDEKEMQAFSTIWEKKYIVTIIKNRDVQMRFHTTLKDANVTFNKAKKKYPCTLSKIAKESEDYKSRKSIPFTKIKEGKIKVGDK